ncbi:MAG: phage integrase N-terminal SAM-like domain-containing protein [Planctomycetaceae bacterium]|nr:phage integrase N-terminal SAM-like domain-containing protein [Planctomycetaceae bacterium]
MTPLRQRMIDEMRLRNYSEHSVSANVSAVYRLSNHYGRRPDRLIREEIRAFLVDLVTEKQVAWSYYKQVLAALRYFYRHVVGRGGIVDDVRGPRNEQRLPVVLIRHEPVPTHVRRHEEHSSRMRFRRDATAARSCRRASSASLQSVATVLGVRLDDDYHRVHSIAFVGARSFDAPSAVIQLP